MTKTDTEAPSVKEEIPHDHLFRVTGLSSSNLEKMAQEVPEKKAHDFEDAISATGYGRFNVYLMLCCFPAFWSAVSVTSSVSYIFTRAQCDLHLSLLDMGSINAITYGGMISSALIWGVSDTLGRRHIMMWGFPHWWSFLIANIIIIIIVSLCSPTGMISSALIWGFLSDTLGRRRIMVWGFIAAGLVELMASVSQNIAMLLVSKYACGFIFNGPFAVLISYIAEMHRTELRARVILLTSLFYTIANTTLPLLAWAILTKEWHFYVWGNSFVFRSWNLFLLVTAMVPFLTGFAFFFMPESPKFLMSRGRNDEAMEVFKKIYSMNMGKPKEGFPIAILIEEKDQRSSTGLAALRGGFAQLLPLFQVPHVPWLILICCIHIGCMFGSNTLRLWYPQLAAMIGSTSGESLCAAIAPANVTVTVTSDVTEVICQPIQTDMLTYLQSAMVGAGSVLTYGIGGILVNRCGKKLVCGFCGVAAASVIVLMPFLGNGPFAVVCMMTAAMAFTSLLGASLSSIAVELFPTSLRVLAMSTFLMAGRLGTIIGTVTFPALIDFGCLPPFITISAVLTACGFACLFVKNTTLQKLE